MLCRRNRNVQSGGNLLDHAVVYPPNGVVPFHGFALFCAPFCYVYSGKSNVTDTLFVRE